MQRLAGLMNSGIESYEEISWRVVSGEIVLVLIMMAVC